MEEKIEKLKFVKLPIDEETGKEQKEFEEMLGHIYIAYYSEFGKGYVILGTNSKEASRAFDNTIYKTLISAGEKHPLPDLRYLRIRSQQGSLSWNDTSLPVPLICHPELLPHPH